MPCCSISLLLALTLSVAPSPTPLEREARAAWDRADAHAAAGSHDDAVAEYARAWQDLEAPEILYSWAQSERLRGHCTEAAALYERFLAEGQMPPASYDDDLLRAQWSNMLANAERQRDACRTPEPTPPEPAADPPPRVVATPTEPASTEALPPDPAPPRRRWQRDAAGWSLTAAGGAALVAGAALVIVAARQDAVADGISTHQRFDDAIERAMVWQRTGFGLVALGGALAAAGVLRFVLVARRPSGRARPVALAPGLGATLVGRF
jgi:hypothetical protein